MAGNEPFIHESGELFWGPVTARELELTWRLRRKKVQERLETERQVETISNSFASNSDNGVQEPNAVRSEKTSYQMLLESNCVKFIDDESNLLVEESGSIEEEPCEGAKQIISNDYSMISTDDADEDHSLILHEKRDYEDCEETKEKLEKTLGLSVVSSQMKHNLETIQEKEIDFISGLDYCYGIIDNTPIKHQKHYGEGHVTNEKLCNSTLLEGQSVQESLWERGVPVLSQSDLTSEVSVTLSDCIVSTHSEKGTLLGDVRRPESKEEIEKDVFSSTSGSHNRSHIIQNDTITGGIENTKLLSGPSLDKEKKVAGSTFPRVTISDLGILNAQAFPVHIQANNDSTPCKDEELNSTSLGEQDVQESIREREITSDLVDLSEIDHPSRVPLIVSNCNMTSDLETRKLSGDDTREEVKKEVEEETLTGTSKSRSVIQGDEVFEGMENAIVLEGPITATEESVAGTSVFLSDSFLDYGKQSALASPIRIHSNNDSIKSKDKELNSNSLEEQSVHEPIREGVITSDLIVLSQSDCTSNVPEIKSDSIMSKDSKTSLSGNIPDTKGKSIEDIFSNSSDSQSIQNAEVTGGIENIPRPSIKEAGVLSVPTLNEEENVAGTSEFPSPTLLDFGISSPQVKPVYTDKIECKMQYMAQELNSNSLEEQIVSNSITEGEVIVTPELIVLSQSDYTSTVPSIVSDSNMASDLETRKLGGGFIKPEIEKEVTEENFPEPSDGRPEIIQDDEVTGGVENAKVSRDLTSAKEENVARTNPFSSVTLLDFGKPSPQGSPIRTHPNNGSMQCKDEELTTSLEDQDVDESIREGREVSVSPELIVFSQTDHTIKVPAFLSDCISSRDLETKLRCDLERPETKDEVIEDVSSNTSYSRSGVVQNDEVTREIENTKSAPTSAKVENVAGTNECPSIALFDVGVMSAQASPISNDRIKSVILDREKELNSASVEGQNVEKSIMERADSPELIVSSNSDYTSETTAVVSDCIMSTHLETTSNFSSDLKSPYTKEEVIEEVFPGTSNSQNQSKAINNAEKMENARASSDPKSSKGKNVAGTTFPSSTLLDFGVLSAQASPIPTDKIKGFMQYRDPTKKLVTKSKPLKSGTQERRLKNSKMPSKDPKQLVPVGPPKITGGSTVKPSKLGLLNDKTDIEKTNLNEPHRLRIPSIIITKPSPKMNKENLPKPCDSLHQTPRTSASISRKQPHLPSTPSGFTPKTKKVCPNASPSPGGSLKNKISNRPPVVDKKVVCQPPPARKLPSPAPVRNTPRKADCPAPSPRVAPSPRPSPAAVGKSRSGHMTPAKVSDKTSSGPQENSAVKNPLRSHPVVVGQRKTHIPSLIKPKTSLPSTLPRTPITKPSKESSMPLTPLPKNTP